MSDNAFILMTIAILSISGTVMLYESVISEPPLSILAFIYGVSLYFTMSYLVFQTWTVPMAEEEKP